MTGGLVVAMAQTMLPGLLLKLDEIAQEPGGLCELAKTTAELVPEYVTDGRQRAQLAEFVRCLSEQLAEVPAP